MDWTKCSNAGVATLGCVPLLIATLIYWGLLLGSTVSVIFIIVGGIRFITSGGDPKKIDQAKRTVAFSILGLFIILLSFFIVNLVGTITGVACIKPLANFDVADPFKTCR